MSCSNVSVNVSINSRQRRFWGHLIASIGARKTGVYRLREEP